MKKNFILLMFLIASFNYNTVLFAMDNCSYDNVTTNNTLETYQFSGIPTTISVFITKDDCVHVLARGVNNSAGELSHFGEMLDENSLVHGYTASFPKSAVDFKTTDSRLISLKLKNDVENIPVEILTNNNVENANLDEMTLYNIRHTNEQIRSDVQGTVFQSTGFSVYTVMNFNLDNKAHIIQHITKGLR